MTFTPIECKEAYGQHASSILDTPRHVAEDHIRNWKRLGYHNNTMVFTTYIFNDGICNVTSTCMLQQKTGVIGSIVLWIDCPASLME